MTGPLVVVGDVLLDREVVGTVDRLCPEAPVPVLAERSVLERPGGAGLAALFAARARESAEADEVVLVAGLSADAGGEALREMLRAHGITVVAMPVRGPTVEKVRLRTGHQLLLRLDRGDGVPVRPDLTDEALDALRSAGSVLVSDYGRGVTAVLAGALGDAARQVPLVWDPHPRGATPVPDSALVTPNRSEAAAFADTGSGPGCPAGEEAGYLRRRWGATAVAVTLGDRGAVVDEGDGPVAVPAPFAAAGDPCGAGDLFATAAVAALAAKESTVDAVRLAVGAASGYVADGPHAATAPAWVTGARDLFGRSV